MNIYLYINNNLKELKWGHKLEKEKSTKRWIDERESMT